MNTTITTENYFDAAQGLYWACVNWHGGQASDLYRISCQLDYRPGACESGPEDDTDAEMVYGELNELGEAGEFANLGARAQAYLDAIQAQYALAHD